MDFVKGHRFERGYILDYKIQCIKHQVNTNMLTMLKDVVFLQKNIRDTWKSLNNVSYP